MAASSETNVAGGMGIGVGMSVGMDMNAVTDMGGNVCVVVGAVRVNMDVGVDTEMVAAVEAGVGADTDVLCSGAATCPEVGTVLMVAGTGSGVNVAVGRCGDMPWAQLRLDGAGNLSINLMRL